MPKEKIFVNKKFRYIEFYDVNIAMAFIQFFIIIGIAFVCANIYSMSLLSNGVTMSITVIMDYVFAIATPIAPYIKGRIATFEKG